MPKIHARRSLLLYDLICIAILLWHTNSLFNEITLLRNASSTRDTSILKTMRNNAVSLFRKGALCSKLIYIIGKRTSKLTVNKNSKRLWYFPIRSALFMSFKKHHQLPQKLHLSLEIEVFRSFGSSSIYF